ncbi:MAG TPA: hypothetical protein PKL79_05390, partial [Rectinema sp.]|nr:hypothetical protein [Rectinema sp.]
MLDLIADSSGARHDLLIRPLEGGWVIVGQVKFLVRPGKRPGKTAKLSASSLEQAELRTQKRGLLKTQTSRFVISNQSTPSTYCIIRFSRYSCLP